VPSVDGLALGLNPSTDPIYYPGVLVQDNYLLTGSWLYSLNSGGNERIGDWSVMIDGGPLSDTGEAAIHLDLALSNLAATVMGQRFPVVAVGCNAAPGRLIQKFSNILGMAVIPLTAANVANIAVAHSAHVSRAGYIPYSPRHSIDGARLFVLWLDINQLSRLDATEPNYTRLTLSDLDRSVVIEASGEPLSAYSFYRSRWGLLRIPPHDAPVAATTQEEVFSLLAKTSRFSLLLPELSLGLEVAMRRLAADTTLRDAIRSCIAECRYSISDDLGESTTTPTAYDAGACAVSRQAAGLVGLRT
jgi:hypothetical protein